MSGIVPQGIYSILSDVILWLTAAWLQFLIVSILEVLLCCWIMSAPADVIFFVNLATVLNKYLGLCLFSSKRDVK